MLLLVDNKYLSKKWPVGTVNNRKPAFGEQVAHKRRKGAVVRVEQWNSAFHDRRPKQPTTPNTHTHSKAKVKRKKEGGEGGTERIS